MRARRVVQLGFLVLCLVGVFIWRGNAERWCPFGGVEALYGYVAEGNLTCSLAVSNFFMLGSVLLIALLLRRAFCGYVCPIGTVFDWLRRVAVRLHIPVWRVTGPLDRGLGLLKYVVLAVVVYFTYRAGELVFRGYDPCYALLSRHGEDITLWAYVISGGLVLASVFIVLPFCRWLCPLAAVLAPLARVGLTRVRREADACSGCGECSAACPMSIEVDRSREVTAARCLTCLSCVEACPQAGAGALRWGPPRWLGGAWPRSLAAWLVVATIGAGVAASYALPLPSFVWSRGDRPAETATVSLEVVELTCRGRANLLVYFLERDDFDAVPGYFRLEAWPGPGVGRARVTYDAARASEEQIKLAIVSPYYDEVGGFWRMSPFAIRGFAPLGATQSGGDDTTGE